MRCVRRIVSLGMAIVAGSDLPVKALMNRMIGFVVGR
jgi:hypothetical protein